MSETRERVAAHVRGRPGVHFRALVRNLDLATGQAQYHLRRLSDENEIVGEEWYGQTHYYPTDYEEWERGVIALLRRETARDVVVTLLDEDEMAPGAIADAIGIARSTLEWHLDRLIAHDLVAKRRVDGRVAVSVTRPAVTARLLREIDPSLPDRLVDRFTRLVDSVLDERGPAAREGSGEK